MKNILLLIIALMLSTPAHAQEQGIDPNAIPVSPDGGSYVTLQDAIYASPVVNKSDSYVLALGDQNVYIRMGKATAQTVTVPPNSSVAFDIGTEIAFMQSGAGALTFVEGSGVTINTPTTLVMFGQYYTAALKKVGTDEWDLTGALQ